MTKSYFNLTKKDVSILTKTIWRILTKENGILIQEPALQYLLSELTSLEGLDSYLEGMAAYCLKEQIKIVDEAVMKIMCSPSFIQVLDKISCNTDNTGGLLAGAQDDFATTLNGAYTKRPHEWKSTIEILASDNFPKIIWNQYKKQLELSSSEPSNLFLSEEARCDNLIDRLQFIRYTLSQVSSQDLANHYGIHNYVASIPSLSGLDSGENKVISLCGMLGTSRDESLVLQDVDGLLPLEFPNSLKIRSGIFHDGSIAVVTGKFLRGKLLVESIELPPIPSFDSYRQSLNTKMDVWSKAEATSLKIDNGDQTYFVILSDVWLDEDSTLAKLEKMISGFGRNDILPSLIIFMGRFSKLEYSFGKNMSANYLAGFQRLSVMLSRHLKLLQQCELVFIPDARDPIPSSLYPLPALPEIFTSKIRSILPNAHFTTNPCRLRYSYSTEILLFKYDLIKKLGTHSIFPYPVTDEKSIRQVAAETILAQGTLLPFSNQQQAIAIGRESMLRFLPPPSLVVIGDTTQQYALTVEGMPVINPGSFSETRGNFIIYYPRSGDCELSSL